MKNQKSFSTHESGILYLVPTPIGNLDDMTFRAVKTLKEVSLIAAEDTRQTKKLLSHFDISNSIVSYHEHNKKVSGDKLISTLLEGKNIGLVSDAGMPSISDPGYDLVREAILNEIPVVPLPGANAALTALIASGLPTEHFYYYGFLPRKKKDKKDCLEMLRNVDQTLIFYESPHRIAETLKVMNEVFGNRNTVLCRELTKKFEEFIRGTLNDLSENIKEETIKGEFVILVEGTSEVEEEEKWWKALSINDHVDYLIEHEQMSTKEAIKVAAKDRGLPKREVYEAYHIK